MYKPKHGDGIVWGGILLTVGVIIFVVFSFMAVSHSMNEADKYNKEFSVRCENAGGSALIGRNNLCLKGERLLFSENAH